jgi:hypothetical protein
MLTEKDLNKLLLNIENIIKLATQRGYTNLRLVKPVFPPDKDKFNFLINKNTCSLLKEVQLEKEILNKTGISVTFTAEDQVKKPYVLTALKKHEVQLSQQNIDELTELFHTHLLPFSNGIDSESEDENDISQPQKRSAEELKPEGHKRNKVESSKQNTFCLFQEGGSHTKDLQCSVQQKNGENLLLIQIPLKWLENGGINNPQIQQKLMRQIDEFFTSNQHFATP